MASLPLDIPRLDISDQNTLATLADRLAQKTRRNLTRQKYYDGKNTLVDLGISIPPRLRNVETVVGWPAKGVDILARRCKLESFVIPGASAEDFGIDRIWDDNSLDIEAPQAHTSAFIHATALIATTLGDVQSGEPEVLVTARDALSGTGIWDPRKRALSSALSIVDADENGSVTELVMYLPDKVVEATKIGPQKWDVRVTPHSLGRVPVEPLVYRPRLGRPFGSSRISRAAMSMTDEAVRTVLRTEVSAEFYSAPQRYILGADPDAFVGADGESRTGWEALLGRMLAIGRDDEGEVPTVGQFPQMSMQPHTDHLRTIASRFAAEQNLPLDVMGIVQDNPSSADAIARGKEELNLEAEAATDVFGFAWTRAIRTGVMMRDNVSTVPDELLSLKAKWRDPATPSRSAAADAVQKQVQTFPWMVDSEVPLEQLGYDSTTIERLLADKRRAGGSAALRAITQAVADGRPVVTADAGTDTAG